MVPRKFIFILPPAVAFMLSYFIDLGTKVRAEERNEGWFYCRVDRIIGELGFNDAQIRGYVQKLEARGFIETERRGIPPKKFFRVCYPVLMAAVSKVQMKSQQDYMQEYYLEEEADD